MAAITEYDKKGKEIEVDATGFDVIQENPYQKTEREPQEATIDVERQVDEREPQEATADIERQVNERETQETTVDVEKQADERETQETTVDVEKQVDEREPQEATADIERQVDEKISIEAKESKTCMAGTVLQMDENGKAEISNDFVGPMPVESRSFTNYFSIDNIAAYAQSQMPDMADLTTWVGIKEVLDYAQKRMHIKGYEPGFNFIIENKDGVKELHMPNAPAIPIPEEQSRDDKLLSSLVAVQTEDEARQLIEGEDRDTEKTIGENNDKNPANRVASVVRTPVADRSSEEPEIGGR